MLHQIPYCSMMGRWQWGAFLAVVLFVPVVASAGLLQNGSFEADSGFAFGTQGVMPAYWEVTNSTPDLYSSDASFGLDPATLGNFTGATAQDGLGWVAGWSDFTESFAQQLKTALTANAEYRLDGYLLQARRNDLDNSGGYEVLLNDSNSLTGAVLVATLGPTTDADEWEFFSQTFIAPLGADQLPWLIFRPYGSDVGGAYPGLDNLSLNSVSEVPEPATVWLMLTGATGVIFVRRRQGKPNSAAV